MKALYMHGKNNLRIVDEEIPSITEDEVLLKVKAVAICGTDIRIINNGKENINKHNPLVLGHEISGIIEIVGSNVKHLEKGMKVSIAPNIGCGICDMCISGNGHMCQYYKAFGVNMDGGFQEYMKMPKEAIAQGNVIEFDDQLTFEEAAMNEPLSCVYNSFTKCSVVPGDTVLVIGAGPIGIMHAKLAKLAGASYVMVNDFSKERLDGLKEIDKDFIPLKREGLKDKVFEITKGKGLNVCITACPSSEAQENALELMAVNGKINFFGGLPENAKYVPLNTNIIHYRQLMITGTSRASISQYRKTLDLIASGNIKINDLISNKLSIEEAYEVLTGAKKISGYKNLICFD